ncbi:MAM and LDL-receptor class A domain-containing protein 2 isoform X1 [Solea solea]|uniref:MAM and LDL-receptor class A domain-containing protein 2 isoform X1 n=1 Tax=Solea solea TaxID=90069 RepID=UPI00272D3BE2|nr:MAM and LDL-receptor class A domain-containing protein 2 isoform X1 [Solea solea]
MHFLQGNNTLRERKTGACGSQTGSCEEFKEQFKVLLVTVSACVDGEFKCTSGECLSTQVVGDFKRDCKDGSGEELCDCDFELHTCGWKDASNEWTRQMVNMTGIPGQDHTTGTPWGHVMHTNKSGFQPVDLEYSVDTHTALACQISFWYYINMDRPSSFPRLQLKMTSNTTERMLLEIPSSTIKSWQKDSAFIGNQPGGFKLLFSFTPAIFDSEGIMLDDISFENCGEGDVPAGSDQLSCDFEMDTCSWYHDYTARLLWDRSARKFQDETKKNYCMLIEAADKHISARLVSFPRPAGQELCVSFWYHIFGNSVGSLKFITKHPGEPETVVWMRTGTQGNKWRFADLSFNSDKPIQFIIEAVASGIQGSIAIDDIVVYSAANGSCLPEKECTFQGSLCGFQPQPSLTWDRIRGTSLPANSSGPYTDHTLGTEQGYYLSAQLRRHPVGSTSTIMTAVMEPTPLDGECLIFWYYMEGSGVGELTVYLQTLDSDKNPQKLWHRSEDQGRHWRHGRVTLLSPGTSYQVIFEATAGDEPRSDIAIDDLTVLNGACPEEGFCDFEMDLCGWVNNPPVESGMEWDWLSPHSERQLIPDRDHTTDSSLGHFVSFHGSKVNELARLESERMMAVDRACLELWHYSGGWSTDRPSSITLTVFVKDSVGLHAVWNTTGYMNKTWIQGRVDYSASEPHQIILQANSSTTLEECFALDDVHIMRNRACDYIIPTTTSAPATTITPAPATAMDCAFEQGLCNWVQEDSDDLKWTLSNGLHVDQPWDGPQYDHTVGNNQGVFLLLNGTRSENGGRAVISVPAVNVKSYVCVGFWYYMLGPSVSTLDLLVQTKSSEVLVWTRRGTQNPEWMNAQVTISGNDITKMMFVGRRKNDSQGFIAIDDIRVKDGACSDQNVCAFESSLCGFENDVSHFGHWYRKKGTKHHVDHTYGTENGFYMSAMVTNKVAQLLTPEISSDTEMCVRFWYWLPAGSSNSLAVHVLQSGLQGEALWQRSGASFTDWEVAEVTVSSPVKFRVGFTAVQVPGTNPTAKLDDISLRDGACTPPGSCDFESGQCSWINVPKEGGHDWFLASGGSHGPPTDHTTQTSQGGFLLSSSLHLNSLAQLVSEWIQLTDTAHCLSLWYYMESSDSGTLRVYLRSGPSDQDQLFRGNSSGHSWSRFSTSVNRIKPFQLLIEAEATNMGFIAIDDISLTPGLCQVNETSSGFGGCSFESGTCDWEDTSDGQLQWVRGRNATGNTGPQVDNTLGTELGWYMAVEPDRGDQISPAALQSPAMKDASATCALHFFYNLYGDDIKELNVVLRVGSRSTALWWLSGSQGDLWQHSEVTVGRVPQDFEILFTATRTFNKPGHLAIDDIDFRNCTLPEPQPLCPENMFVCNNRVCVEHSNVCDFSDDCGDWSDEINCEQHGVVERCSFNMGLCSWTQSDVDTPGDEWKVGQGLNMWPNHGPPRDHTQNSAAGFYIIPATHLTMKGQTSEILSKTLLPGLNCSVRFFYFSLDGDAAARLTVLSRTLGSGSGDTLLWLRENSQNYSWQRADVMFSSSANSKIVFRYEHGDARRGLVAVDDISFSKECEFDPENNKLPDTVPTSLPSTSFATTSTTQVKPCQDNELFCWASTGEECILATLQCDYHSDCPQGEDEDGCGACSFENNQCQWTDISEGESKWQRDKASDATEPPTDHTTHTGYYMRVNVSQASTQGEARLQSPQLSPSSHYCQIMFHFHISAENTGSLRVLMQQAGGSEAILWSRSHNTVSDWSAETLLLGLHQQPYKVLLSSTNKPTRGAVNTGGQVFAVDDISFLNCEKYYQPPALSAYGCSFEDGLCVWIQGAEDELDWLSMSGPTEANNTGPTGDHTTGKGKYLYIKSSPPSVNGHMAQLKSLPLPPAGETGYCLTFWYHMFGATVGSLRILLQTADPMNKTLVWQKSRNQGDEWLLVQSHVMLQEVHQVVLEATVGGEAGDIAIDDISFISGHCPVSDLCDFEEGTCNWQQHTTDDFDWIRESGSTHNPNTGPDTDHTTNTPTGHYYCLPSSAADRAGQTAAMSSPLFPTEKGACVQLWYHMYGKGMGTLNVYQQSEDGKEALIFSQTGDHGKLWRFAQASLLPRVQPYKIVVEGVKAGPTQEGDMAFDDIHLTDARCPPPGFCDFETNTCGWSNLGGGVDQGDWLRGTGASTIPNAGPSTDHTTNSTHGHYLYVDSSVGEWGDMSFLVSEVFQPSTRGHCLTFWYHMYGNHVGTLRVFINDRQMHTGGNEEGMLIWIETGNRGDEWKTATVSFKHETAFWLVFVYQRGVNPGGDVSLDDITVFPSSCYSDPPPEDSNDITSIVLAVTLTLLAGFIISVLLFMLNRKCSLKNLSPTINNDAADLVDCQIDGTRHGSDLSFDNKVYDPSPSDASVVSSDA